MIIISLVNERNKSVFSFRPDSSRFFSLFKLFDNKFKKKKEEEEIKTYSDEMIGFACLFGFFLDNKNRRQ